MGEGRRKRGRPPKKWATLQEVPGSRYIREVLELLQPLHSHQDHRNRKLHYDELTTYILLLLFTPVLDSLRGLQHLSQYKVLERRFGLRRFSLGSFSEATGVFDPQLIEGILGELADRVLQQDQTSPEGLELAATIVDGTLIRALPRMTWALWRDDEHRAAKLHLHYSLLNSVPFKPVLTEGNGDERTVLRSRLASGMLYLLDRGYAAYDLLNDILDRHSSFVVRVRENASYEVLQELPISPEAAAAHVVFDRVVQLGTEDTPALHGRRIRLIRIERPVQTLDRPKVSRKAKSIRVRHSDAHVMLATDQLDLSADQIAQLYRYRWQIELFFRWFKKVLKAERLIAESRNGLTIVVYCALIASLLATLWTGRKPTKRLFEAFVFHFMGLCSAEELMERIARLS